MFSTCARRTRLWCQNCQEKGHKIGDQTLVNAKEDSTHLFFIIYIYRTLQNERGPQS